MTKATCKRKYLIRGLIPVSEVKSMTTMAGSKAVGRQACAGTILRDYILSESRRQRERQECMDF